MNLSERFHCQEKDEFEVRNSTRKWLAIKRSHETPARRHIQRRSNL
jgi:hypothetical protein